MDRFFHIALLLYNYYILVVLVSGVFVQIVPDQPCAAGGNNS